jgi:hypothetical protein
MVTHFKHLAIRESPFPMLADDFDEVWSRMNQDFALEGGHNEEYDMSKKTRAVIKSVTKVHLAAPVLAHEEWMAMNQDFACEARHDMEDVEHVSKPRASAPSLQEPHGDYGVWWE